MTFSRFITLRDCPEDIRKDFDGGISKSLKGRRLKEGSETKGEMLEESASCKSMKNKEVRGKEQSCRVRERSSTSFKVRRERLEEGVTDLWPKLIQAKLVDWEPGEIRIRTLLLHALGELREGVQWGLD